MNFLRSKENIKALIAFVFVLSGAAGLIYQIVWFKYLALFLGNSTYAQMTVLAAFLGGIALGNNYFGNKIERFKNPLKIYGLLEIIIGLYCIFYPAINSVTGNLFLSFSASMNFNPSSIQFNFLRLLVSAILLVPPTFAMGGTLPVLSQYFVDKLETSRRDIAILYYLNSFGAVCGVMLGGFLLIKSIGLNYSLYFAAVINISAGMFSLLISKQFEEKASDSNDALNENEQNVLETNPDSNRTITTIVVVVAGISGAAALLYEMVWTRLLITVFGSSTYAFSIMLMSFISGITIGGWLISKKIFSKYDKYKLLAILQLLIGFCTMAVLLFYDRMPYFLWNVAYLFSKTEEAFPFFLITEFIICFVLILLPTLFMGMSLPLAIEIVSTSNKRIGFSVGKVFSINTLGNVTGVILSSLIFIPFLGIHNTFIIGVGLNFLAALLIFFFYNVIAFRNKIIYSSSVIFILLIYFFGTSSFNQNVMTSGVFKMFKEKPPESYQLFLDLFKYEKIVYYNEGSAATVAVTEWTDNPANKRLIINGKPDASSFLDMPTQVLLGQIPMMLAPNPENVFVVGFGTGTTIGSVLTHPVKKVVCAEISKGVIEASQFFKKENKNCLNDSRLKLYNEDAVTLLKIRKEKFDAIISEPSNPWIAGIGNLFSQEYFKTCYNKLNNGGIMVQWFHLYEANDETVKLVLNTFSSVFEYAQMWSTVGNDILLVGSKTDIRPNFSALEKKFEIAAVKKDFENINIKSTFTFLCNQTASPKNFFAMASGYPINTEIHPLLEFVAPMAQYLSNQSTYIYSFDEKFDTLSRGLLIKDYVKIHDTKKEELYNAAEYAFKTSQNYRFAYGLSKYLLENYPGDYNINRMYINAEDAVNINKGSTALLEKLTKLFPDSIKTSKEYNNFLLLQRTNASTFLKIYSLKKQADFFLGNTQTDTLSRVKTLVQVALAYLKNGEFSLADSVCKEVDSLLTKSPRIAAEIVLDDYYYTASITALYDKNIERLFTNYLALLNTNPRYGNLFRLRRYVTWYLSKESNSSL